MLQTLLTADQLIDTRIGQLKKMLDHAQVSHTDCSEKHELVDKVCQAIGIAKPYHTPPASPTSPATFKLPNKKSDAQNMSVGKLRNLLDQLSVSHTQCVEKRDLVQLVCGALEISCTTESPTTPVPAGKGTMTEIDLKAVEDKIVEVIDTCDLEELTKKKLRRKVEELLGYKNKSLDAHKAKVEEWTKTALEKKANALEHDGGEVATAGNLMAKIGPTIEVLTGSSNTGSSKDSQPEAAKLGAFTEENLTLLSREEFRRIYKQIVGTPAGPLVGDNRRLYTKRILECQNFWHKQSMEDAASATDDALSDESEGFEPDSIDLEQSELEMLLIEVGLDLEEVDDELSGIKSDIVYLTGSQHHEELAEKQYELQQLERIIQLRDETSESEDESECSDESESAQAMPGKGDQVVAQPPQLLAVPKLDVANFLPEDAASQDWWNNQMAIAGTFVYKNYYSKPFPKPGPDAPSNAYIDWEPVHGVAKPNHGLGDAMRKAWLIPHVLRELRNSAHIQEGGLSQKSFDFGESTCTMVLAMQFAMLFEVCGRLSDIGYSDDPDTFMEYHKTAYTAFSNFSAPMFGGDVFDTVLEALERMYMHPKSNRSRPVKLILETCHDLDLFRCYGKSRMQEKMAKIAESVGKEACIRLVELAETAIVLTGDRLMYSGMGSNTRRSYDAELFPRCSKNARECWSVLLALGDTMIAKHDTSGQSSSSENSLPDAAATLPSDAQIDGLFATVPGMLGLPETEQGGKMASMSQAQKIELIALSGQLGNMKAEKKQVEGEEKHVKQVAAASSETGTGTSSETHTAELNVASTTSPNLSATTTTTSPTAVPASPFSPSNPAIIQPASPTVSLHDGAAPSTASEAKNLPTSQLKSQLRALGVDFAGCVEKSELVALICIALNLNSTANHSGNSCSESNDAAETHSSPPSELVSVVATEHPSHVGTDCGHMQPQDGPEVAEVEECDAVKQSLATSNFKRIYKNTLAPSSTIKLMSALEDFVDGFCVHASPRIAKSDGCTFVKDLQKRLMMEIEEYIDDKRSVAQRLWTSACKLNDRLELCSMINGVIRGDTPELVELVTPLCRCINELCISRLSPEIAQKLPYPADCCTYRGGVLPSEHVKFFADLLKSKNKKYRVPGYLATSFSSKVAKQFAHQAFLQSREDREEDPYSPVIWKIKLNPEGKDDFYCRTMNANFVEKTDVKGTFVGK